jgi:hypothetical protein
VEAVLSDPRSWAGHRWNGQLVALQRVGSGYHGEIDFHLTLTSAKTVRDICGYEYELETSCYLHEGAAWARKPDRTLRADRVIVNELRWTHGATAYIGDLDAYRTYLINHEVGHALGHQHAHACLPDGLAPAMMEQSIGLISATAHGRKHKMCKPNPWPYPRGVKHAPGREAADNPTNNEFALNGYKPDNG